MSFFDREQMRWRYDVQYGVAIVRPATLVIHNIVEPPEPPMPKRSPMARQIERVASKAVGAYYAKRFGAFRYWAARFDRLAKIERKLYGVRR